MFYFKSIDSTIFLTLFLLELGYIAFLFFKYFGWNYLSNIAEINVTLDDPFTLLALINLPMLLFNFNKIIKKNIILLFHLSYAGILFGIFQDIDNSLLGKYIFNNKYNKLHDKKKYKIIYRIGLAFLWWSFIYKFCSTTNTAKNGSIFIIFYLLTSVVSLYLQIILEEHKEHTIFIEKVNNIKTKLSQNNIFNH